MRKGRQSVWQFTFCTQDDDGRMVALQTHLLKHFNAIHFGQHDIENDQVVLALQDGVETAGAVCCMVRFKSGLLQAGHHEVGNLDFVLNDQDVHSLAFGYLHFSQVGLRF